jgi:Beta-1,3-glucanase
MNHNTILASDKNADGSAAPPQPPKEPLSTLHQAPQQVPLTSHPSAAPGVAAATAGTLNIALVNNTSSSNAYAYLNGLALEKNNAVFFLQADGKTPYYPASPPHTVPPSPPSPLSQNCAIPMGNPGNIVHLNIPHIASGRIWFSVDQKLTFLLNEGPSVVQPSPTNPTDPNINTYWGFCEFTFDYTQLYANISYVDFVSLPISMSLSSASGPTQVVTGMPAGALDKICSKLKQQGGGWEKLVVTHNGKNLRALSANQATVMDSTLFKNYYDDYVNRVWTKLLSPSTMVIDTQTPLGTIHASVKNNLLTCDELTFQKPTTHDIWTCNSGPFVVDHRSPKSEAIVPRVAAAFNRSTFLQTPDIPAPRNKYYLDYITNHYSRICHEVNLDGRGYAFPYDDVQPTGGPDQSGAVQAGDPVLLTVTLGRVR